METFGVMAFVLVMLLWSKVSRLERILRENNIRPGGTGSLGSQLQKKIGQSMAITLYEQEGSTTAVCKILDVDEQWAKVLRNEGKKTQRELLIRLSDVKQVKG